MVEIGLPQVTPGFNKNVFEWPEASLRVVADRITDDGKAELYFFHENGNGSTLLHMGQANLLSSTMYRDFAKALQSRGIDVDWQTVLTAVSKVTMQRLREGTPLLDMDEPPQYATVNYLLEPMLAHNQPTTLYAPGGSGKSVFCDFVSVLVQHGHCSESTPFRAIGQNNVLYLDWESTIDEHRRYVQAIKRGMGITDKRSIMYEQCEYPLAQIVDKVRQQVVDNHIGLVIVDSQMAATAGYSHAMSEAQVASAYYNDLRSFECATLTVDHVTKSSLQSENGAEMPYGSVVKYNRSRSQFEFRKQQDVDTDYIEVALVHKKFNLGRLLKPIGIRMVFHTEDNELDMITIETCDIADNRKLSKVLPIKTRLFNALQTLGSASVIDLAGYIDANEGSVRTELSRSKDMFIKLSNDNWGILEQRRGV